MELLAGKNAAARVAGIINSRNQVHGNFVQLTVRSVYELDPAGEADFGGREYAPARKLEVATRHRRSEDTYP